MPIAAPTTAPRAISGELTAIPTTKQAPVRRVLLEEDLPDAPERTSDRVRNRAVRQGKHHVIIPVQDEHALMN